MKKLLLFVSLALITITLTEAKVFHALDYSNKRKLPSNYKFVNLPIPTNNDLGRRLKLWATWYNLPIVRSVQNGTPLRDLSGISLGPVLTKRDWCFAAMEGSVVVANDEDQFSVTYNYAGTSDFHPVDCREFFSWNVSRTKFRVARGVYGDGFLDYILVPFRTIAVDARVIPYGTVIYIPDAVGKEVRLPTGEIVIHDGYFFAGDKGGAIKNNHIDVFIATETTSPFPFIRNNPRKTFRAYTVTNPEIIEYITRIHFL